MGSVPNCQKEIPICDAIRWFKCKLKPPKNVELLCNLDSDDDFCHVSCHIDDALKNKIEKGEYVDLDRLLPKDRSIAGQSMNDGVTVQLYTKNGQAYFAPPDSEKRIDGIRR